MRAFCDKYLLAGVSVLRKKMTFILLDKKYLKILQLSIETLSTLPSLVYVIKHWRCLGIEWFPWNLTNKNWFLRRLRHILQTVL